MDDNYIYQQDQNQIQDYKKEDLRNKKFFLTVVAGTIILFIVVIVAFIVFMITKPAEDTGEDDNIPPVVYFENRSILTSNLDTNPSNEVSTHIESVVLNDTETQSAPRENDSRSDGYITYTTTIEESSFRRLEEQPEYTFTFNISISDGRRYNVIAFEDDSYGNFYIGTIIKRIDTTDNDYVFYDYNEDELYYGEEFDYQAALDSWISNFPLNNPSFDTSDLKSNVK